MAETANLLNRLPRNNITEMPAHAHPRGTTVRPMPRRDIRGKCWEGTSFTDGGALCQTEPSRFVT
jgi:hypothetical protein